MNDSFDGPRTIKDEAGDGQAHTNRTPFEQIGSDQLTSTPPAPRAPMQQPLGPASPTAVPWSSVAPTPTPPPPNRPSPSPPPPNQPLPQYLPPNAQPFTQQFDGPNPNDQYPSSAAPKTSGLIAGAAVACFLLAGGVVVAVGAIFAADSSTDRSPLETQEIVEAASPENGPAEIAADPGFDRSGPPLPDDVRDVVVADGTIEVFPGEIYPNGFDTFFVVLEAGSFVTVTAQANGSDLDTVLVVVDPTGEQVGANDDAAAFEGLINQLDSQVEFTTNVTGRYAFEVVGFDAESAGQYVLTVDRTG